VAGFGLIKNQNKIEIPAERVSSGASSRQSRKIRNANVVRLCERIRGSMGCSASPPGSRRPVKAARPKVAAMPHNKAAVAM